MKTLICQLVLSLVVAVLLTGAVAPAEASDTLTAVIPFDFHVGKALMPAGEYEVKLNFGPSPRIMVRSADGHQCALALTMIYRPKTRPVSPHLVFNRYGSEYYMWRAATNIDNNGWELRKSKAEIELARSCRPAPSTQVALKIGR